MRLRPVLPVLVTVVLSGAFLGAQAQLTLLASFIDPATGNPPETLTAAEIGVTEDDVAAKVVKVEPVLRSVRIEVLIDNGIGIGRNIAELRTGVRKLIEALPSDTETALVVTSPQPRFLVRATKSRDELLKGVDRLAPDSATGRFTESLAEAVERANKAKDAFTAIVAAGTTSGDARVGDTDAQRVLGQIGGRPMIVYVLLYSGEQSASGGTMQVEVGQRAAQMTEGRYELINSISRYVTLLPELGADAAKRLAGSTRQFRITVQRPDGKKGNLGKISVSSTTKKLSGLWRE
jgi:hypothetical protein